MNVTMPTPPAGFDPHSAEFHNVTPERFTAVPKESHRRNGGDRELQSLTALGLLTLYLSNKTGWKPPNATTLASKYKEGAKVIRDAIAEIERAGYLVRYSLQNKAGHWITHTIVSAYPESLEELREWARQLKAMQDAAASERKAAGVTGGGRKASEAARAAGITVGPTRTDATFSQVGPDVSYRDSVHRVPVRRDSVDRDPVQGDLKEQETRGGDQEEKGLGEKTSNPPPPPAPAPHRVPAERGGNSPRPETPNPHSALETLALELAGIGGWDVTATANVLEQLRLSGKHTPAEIASVMRQAAEGTWEHGTTKSPNRLLHWWPAPKAATAQLPVRHIEAGRKRCNRHLDFPADGCRQCVTDAAIAAREANDRLPESLTGPAMGSAAAREMARAYAASARRAERGLPRQVSAPALATGQAS